MFVREEAKALSATVDSHYTINSSSFTQGWPETSAAVHFLSFFSTFATHTA